MENKSKMVDGRHLEELGKSRYLHNRLTNFDEIWQCDASETFASCQPLKFLEFKNSRWRRATIFKNQNITMPR